MLKDGQRRDNGLFDMHGYLCEPKYRICKIKAPNESRVIFFCDWDCMHKPSESFVGKPVYIQKLNTGGIGFRKKSIFGNLYYDFAKVKPEGVYLCDLGLKTILANIAPSLLINNRNSILSTLCMVPIECVENEVPSSLAKNIYYEHNRNFANICDKLEEILPYNCELGLVGYQALNVGVCEKKLAR
jgi:hypothetical protein